MVNTPVVGQQRIYYNNIPANNAMNGSQGHYQGQQNKTMFPVSPSALNTKATYSTWKNPETSNVTQNDTVLTILHMNDNHRKVKGLANFKTAFDQIANQVKVAGADLIKVHSGDYNAGIDQEKLKLQIEMLNDLGINYAALGNHEFDIGPAKLAKELVNSKFVSLAANLVIPQNVSIPEIPQLQKSEKLAQSAIHEVNGNKYGVIGLTPPDLKARSDSSTQFHGIDVLNEQQTIQKVQEEIDKLTAQGINKIMLVSHVGVDMDKKIAQQTKGLDIILGGHSHDLLNPLEPGVSLLKTAANEPVLIFQNGKDAKFFGVTDATFDQNGIIKAAIARQEEAADFQPDPKLSALEDKILGPSPVIGVVADSYKAGNVKLKENPIANFIADAVKAKTGAPIALVQGFAVRDNIAKGNITERDVDEVLPFIDAVHVSKISGQDLIDALSNGAKTYVRPNVRPGILQVSGLKYTISPQGNAENIMVQQSNGNYTPIDPNQEYTVAYDQFMIKGSEGFTTLAQPHAVVKAYMEDNADIVKEYIKAHNMQPITMKTEGRITVQAKDPMANTATPKAYQKAQAPYGQTVSQPQTNVPVASTSTNNNMTVKHANPVMQPNVAYRMPVYPAAAPQYNYYPFYPTYNPFIMPPGVSPFNSTR
jgi:5'-nucleotidase / UDP-sugar diphosphatase